MTILTLAPPILSIYYKSQVVKVLIKKNITIRTWKYIIHHYLSTNKHKKRLKHNWKFADLKQTASQLKCNLRTLATRNLSPKAKAITELYRTHRPFLLGPNLTEQIDSIVERSRDDIGIAIRYCLFGVKLLWWFRLLLDPGQIGTLNQYYGYLD